MKPAGLLEAISELSHDKGLDQDIVIEALEDAIVAAAYRKYKDYRNIDAIINKKSGTIELMHFKTVVEEVTDPDNQISLKVIQELDPDTEIGDEVEYEIDIEEFRNVIAQTARQLVFQKIREVERESIIEKYSDKKGDIVHGTVARIERGGKVVLVLNNNIEALLEKKEQILFEKLQPGDHVRAMLYAIRSEGRGPSLLVSRTHPDFLIKLFTMEVPEVYEGIVEILGAAREPGKRAKMSVRAKDPDIDPVGSCVGIRGSRVQAVVTELCGERIDIVEWDPNTKIFVQHALSPAEIFSMNIDDENQEIDVTVEQDQLSLAIGKQGQNVRLASRLTGFRINVAARSNNFENITTAFRTENEKEEASANDDAAPTITETQEDKSSQ